MDNITELNEKQKEVKTKKPKDKKKVTAIVIFVVGLAALIGGLVFMLLNIFAKPGVRDAEYLVQIGQWKLNDEECRPLKCAENTKCVDMNGEAVMSCEDSGVIWNFTEIGKGTLTTNNHQNDYDFIWAMEEDELKIETDWLYDLENEYKYKLDQGKNTLVLTSDDKSWTFIPATSENE